MTPPISFGERDGRAAGPPLGVRIHGVPSLPALLRSAPASVHHAVGTDGRVIALVDEGDDTGPCPCAGRREVEPTCVHIALELPPRGASPRAQDPSVAALAGEVARRWGMGIPGPSIHGSDPRLLELAPRITPHPGEEIRPAVGGRPNLLCLLAVRNASADLPRMLASVAGTCDGVLALDDGSTDDTRGILEEHPAVLGVLRNRPRPTAASWHDGANRNRLLAAAGALRPQWAVFLDADEILPERDAVELARWLATDPDPTAAYGFRLLRMWGPSHHEAVHRWVYRLFSYRPGTWVPTRRLHFDPVPVDIPRARYRHAPIRILHVGASSPSRLRAAEAKYHEVDPAARWGPTPPMAPPDGRRLVRSEHSVPRDVVA